MDKRLVATVSMLSALGGAGFLALIVHLQSASDSLREGPAQPEARPALVNVRAERAQLAPVQDSTAAQSDEGSVIELEPVRITPHSPARAPLSVEQKPLEPCSPWRDLGPNYVDDGAGTGTHRVRELC